jgi:hypothetical protein
MKYPYTSMVIGQLIMNQPIEIELWNNFQDEYYHYTREVRDEDKSEISYLRPFGTMDFATFLMELSGSGISINTYFRDSALYSLEVSIKEFLDKFGDDNFPKLDAEYPLDKDTYLQEKPSTIRWSHSKEAF